MLKKFLGNKEVKNASWLISGKIVQMLLSLVVSVLTARYLGPGSYGLINYGTAYVNFFMSLCTLGINSIIVKDFFDNPEQQGVAIGSTIILRLISSFCSALIIIGIVFFLDNDEPETVLIVALCSISLIFQAFDTFNYWFQAQYRSKITAIATLIAYTVTALYRIVLLINAANIRWFALATSIDYLTLGLLLFLIYKKEAGPTLKFSWKKAKDLLKHSYHYILSGMMVAIYGQTDKLMLKQMIDEVSVGYYSTATSICSVWTFVLSAIIDSFFPTIMQLYKTDRAKFERKNRQLYAMVFYISIAVSVGFMFLGDLAIEILYGSEYAPASTPLKIVTWYTGFSYLGVARNAWVVCEGQQKYLKYIYLGGAIGNVVLNLLLIPQWGTAGAAMASLITQILTSVLLPFLFKGMRRNSILLLQSIFFIDVFGKRVSKNP